MNSQYKGRADLSAHPEFASLYKDTEGVPCVWRNTFECQAGHDLEVWSDEWSCTCDVSCPVCGNDHTPVSVWIGPVSTEALELWDKLTETLEAASSDDSASSDEDGMTVDQSANTGADKPDIAWDEAVNIIRHETQGADDTARLAARALSAIYPSYDNDTAKTAIMDCLSDMRHLCDLMGWSFSCLDKEARLNYSQEVMEHGPAENALLKDVVGRDLS